MPVIITFFHQIIVSKSVGLYYALGSRNYDMKEFSLVRWINRLNIIALLRKNRIG